MFGDRGLLSEEELQEASQDFGTLLGGFNFPLTFTAGPFAWSPFGKAMAARQRMKDLILAKVEACRSSGCDEGLLSDLVAARLEDGTSLSDEQLVDNLISLLIAGFGFGLGNLKTQRPNLRETSPHLGRS